MSVRSAAKYLYKSREFVNKWVQRYKDTKCVDDLPDRGSKRSTTAREDRTIFQVFSKNPQLSLRKGQAVMARRSININIMTLRRRLQENNIAWRSMMAKPLLSRKHVRKSVGVGSFKY
ncbi:hypothetical protein ANTQUA_LOCUS4227 [Anthophora quadrimaculata]